MLIKFSPKQTKILKFVLYYFGLCGLIFAYSGNGIPTSIEVTRVNSQTPNLLRVENYLSRWSFLKDKLTIYSVQSGETLYSISRRYFISPESLASINHIQDPTTLKAGQTLYIPPVNPNNPRFLQLYKVCQGDTIKYLLKKYNIEMWQFSRLNPNIFEPLPVDALILLPKIPVYINRGSRPHFRLLKPVHGVLTSAFGWRWGRMHRGIDLAAPIGTPVKAAAQGEVIFVGWRSGYGLLVQIKHGSYLTYYGHLSRVMVKAGDQVTQGDCIGFVGETGRATGPHLHFEVERNHVKVNPVDFLNL